MLSIFLGASIKYQEISRRHFKFQEISSLQYYLKCTYFKIPNVTDSQFYVIPVLNHQSVTSVNYLGLLWTSATTARASSCFLQQQNINSDVNPLTKEHTDSKTNLNQPGTRDSLDV